MSAGIAYSDEVAEAICARLAGGRSLRRICGDGDMPSLTSVMRWLAERPQFRQRYAVARSLQADLFADQILEIADGDDGASGSEAVQRARLRVDTRKWLMARLAPRKYGDKLLSGESEGDAAVVVQVIRYDDDPAAQ